MVGGGGVFSIPHLPTNPILTFDPVHPSPVEPPPSGIEYYIHRAGRTGRKGQPGLAILVYSGGMNERGINAGDLIRQVSTNNTIFIQ